jgi:hypothetical protein
MMLKQNPAGSQFLCALCELCVRPALFEVNRSGQESELSAVMSAGDGDTVLLYGHAPGQVARFVDVAAIAVSLTLVAAIMTGPTTAGN